jgi:predicted aminopeptidase
MRPLRSRLGAVALVLLAIAAGGALLVAATPMGRYIARAAWEEGRILRGRRPIARLVADSTVPSATRAKLRLVLEARAFANDSLRLPAKQAFTQFTQLESDTLVLVLSGARRDWLEGKSWWFPVVGRVPYKGFFKVDDALRAERGLAADGYDTYLRPAPAFSTLGWFNDPLLSTSLGADSVDLVNTVIHELTHNRYYAKDGAVFNESFANFVGARGAERFFLSRGDSVSAARSVDRWADDRLLGAYWATLYRALDSAFRSVPGDSARARRLAIRDSVYGAARRVLVDSIGPRLRTIPPAYAARVRLDNAALMARRIYLTDLERFERAFDAEGRDLERTIQRLIREHSAGEDTPPPSRGPGRP